VDLGLVEHLYIMVVDLMPLAVDLMPRLCMPLLCLMEMEGRQDARALMVHLVFQAAAVVHLVLQAVALVLQAVALVLQAVAVVHLVLQAAPGFKSVFLFFPFLGITND